VLLPPPPRALPGLSSRRSPISTVSWWLAGVPPGPAHQPPLLCCLVALSLLRRFALELVHPHRLPLELRLGLLCTQTLDRSRRRSAPVLRSRSSPILCLLGARLDLLGFGLPLHAAQLQLLAVVAVEHRQLLVPKLARVVRGRGEQLGVQGLTSRRHATRLRRGRQRRGRAPQDWQPLLRGGERGRRVGLDERRLSRRWVRTTPRRGGRL
jgi:hypothetical protein